MAAVMNPDVQVRAMRRSDLGEVADLEQAAYPFPWSKRIFAECLRVRYCCRVADIGGCVVAYAIQAIAASEAHILNLCVAPEWRRCGLARRLLSVLLDDARTRFVERVFLEVRPSNTAAIALYESAGFQVIGRRIGYYPAAAGREDAVVMSLRLA